MSDDAAVTVTKVRYRCRFCEATKPVYVSVRELAGESVIDAHNVRLWHGYCETCDCERTHVADPEGVDVDLDAAQAATWGVRSR